MVQVLTSQHLTFGGGATGVPVLEVSQAWELAADPRISVEKKKPAPKNKTVCSN